MKAVRAFLLAVVLTSLAACQGAEITTPEIVPPEGVKERGGELRPLWDVAPATGTLEVDGTIGSGLQ